MDSVDCSKPYIIKEELCKDECEVIIDVVEDNSNFNITSLNYPTYNHMESSNKKKINNNEKAGSKNPRPKVQMRFGCMICDYKTSNSTNFKIHLRTHTGEKPYKCELCPYRAKVLCALYRHKRVHTGERPYACNECSYRAAQPSHLVRHKMIHTGERPHSCNLCNYSASQMSHLVRHMSVHTNYRPFPCTECTYRAKRKSHLQKHISTHEKERHINALCSRQLRSTNRNIQLYKYDNDEISNKLVNVCKFCTEDRKKSEEKHRSMIIEQEDQMNSSISHEDNQIGKQIRDDNCDEEESEENSHLTKPTEENVDPLAETAG